MHGVFCQRVGRDRPESAGADVERQRANLDALLRQPVKQRFGEMQPRRRRRHGARHLGVHGLVADPIALDHLALADVRWQRNPADAIQQRENVFGRRGPGDPTPVAFLRAQHQVEVVASGGVDQGDQVVGPELSPRLADDPPQAVGAGLDKQALPMSARAHPAANEPRGNDSRVVNHQAVPPAENRHEVADVLVLQGVAAAIDQQQPGIAAANRRRLGNQPLRQIVVVIGQFRHYPFIVGKSVAGGQGWRPS